MFRTAPRPVFAIGLVLSLVSLPLLAEEPRGPAERARQALSYDTVSANPPPPRTVVTPSTNALAIDGHFDLGGYVFKNGVPFLHNDGGAAYRNTAFGLDALISLTPSMGAHSYGAFNTALGFNALEFNTTGYRNTATGPYALNSNTTGFRNTAVGVHTLANNESSYNTAIGAEALYSNMTGLANTAVGTYALLNNTTGSANTAIGESALASNMTGERNIALGLNSGGSAGSDSIWISSLADESNTLRIGQGTGTGDFQQNRAFISGIHNATLSGTGEQSLCVDDADQVGPCSISSARFKRDIRAMGEASAGLENLRAVVFKYRPQVKDDADAEHFGLLAEEVAEIYPHLVTTDAEGRPFSVRYDLLTPLLLNELQAQQRRVAALAKRNAELQATQRDLVGRLRRLEALAAGDP